MLARREKLRGERGIADEDCSADCDDYLELSLVHRSSIPINLAARLGI